MTDFQCSMRTFQVVLAMIALVPSALVLTINGQEIVWKEEESRKFESKAASLPERFWNDGTPLMLLDDEKDDDPPDCNDTHSSRYDPLACWLQQLKVAIPDQEFKKSFFKVHVRDLVCTNFTVDGLESSYTPSNDKLDPSIDLAVNGVSTLCQGTYKVSPGDISGEIHAKAITGGTEATNVDSKLETNHLKEDTAIDLTWKFLPTYQPPDTKKYKMPYALRTIKCRADLQVSELHFTGSISAKIINLFSSMIADTVSDQLNQQLCPLIQKQVDPIVTKALKSANGFLSKYLPGRLSAATSLHDSNHLFQTAKLLVPSQRESATFAAQSTTTLDFKKDTPLLVKYLHAINHFLDCFYASQSVDRGLSDIFDLAEECNGLVNKSLRGILSLILDGLAEIVSIPLPAAAHKIQFAVPKYGEILLDIQDLYIQGLDQLNHLSLFLPVSKGEGAPISNFLTKLQSTTGLNVTADLHITVTAMEGGIFQGDPLQETFHVNFNLSSLSALGDLALAFEKSQFQHIQIGTILDVLPFYHSQHHTENNSTAEEECIIDSIQDANVADLEVQTVLESVTVVPHLKSKVNVPSQKTPSMTLSKKLEEDLDGLLNHVLKLVLNEYQPTLTAAVSGLVKKPLADCLNHWIQEKLEKYENPSWLYSRDKSLEMDELSGSTALSDSKDKRCKGDESIDQDHHQLANFSDVGLLHKLNLYLNKADTIRSINRAIEHAARKFEKKYSSWTFAENTSPSSSWLSKTELPGMSIELVDFTIENSGNLNHIDVLSPELDGMHLKNGFSYGVDASQNLPKIHASVGVIYHPRNLSGVLNATIALKDVHLDGGSILHLDMTRLRQLTLSRLFSHGHCFIAPFQQHKIYNNHNVSRIGKFLGNASVTVTGDPGFKNFTAYTDTEKHSSVAAFIISLGGWMLDTLQESTNSAAHSSFEQAEGYCTGGQKFGYDDDPPILNDEYKDEWLLPIVGIFAGILVVAQTALFFALRSSASNRRSSVDAGSFGSSSDITQPLLHNEPTSVASFSVDGETKPKKDSLLQSSAMSSLVRHSIPIFIIGTIVLLLSSNVSSGATVDLYISLNESRTVSLPSLFTFSLLNTAKDMWQAKIYPLFFLVLIMSGIWPYLKLLLMLLAWVLPTGTFSAGTRERLLLALDALGKFALVDTYLFVLMMVAFRYHLSLSDKISVDAFVSPETGFYTFLVATCFSLIAGHLLIFFHRKTEMKHLIPRRDSRYVDYRESVFEHKFLVDGNNNDHDTTYRLQMSRGFQIFLVAMALLAALLLGVGTTRESFRFEIGGIAGDILGEDRISYYSLLSLGSSLRKSVRDPSKGIVFLEVAYYFYAVVTPFACLGLLVFLLVCPMTLKTQRFFLTLTEIANAWSAVEVFVISIIASLLEISTFASFIIGDKCDLINKILKEYFASAIPDSSDATCFTVRSTVQTSSCFLVAGVLVNSFVVSLVLRFVHSSVAERIETEMEGIPAHPFDDALASSSASTQRATIANFFAWGCFRRLVFDDHGPHAASANGYVPQSMDTLSVDPSVHWDDSMVTNTTPNQTPTSERERPNNGMSTTSDVRETIRDAFQSVEE